MDWEKYEIYLDDSGEIPMPILKHGKSEIERTRAIYQAKGYSADWIEKRMRGIAIRRELTDKWKQREAKEQIEYAILTA